MVDALPHLPALRTLKLEGCGLEDRELSAVLAVLPLSLGVLR